MLVHSAEMRWFGRDAEELRGIFDAIPGVSSGGETRTDTYLLTGSADIGIKYRQGQVEVKWLHGDRQTHFIDGTYVGILEEWTKISVGQEVPGAFEEGETLDVHKTRWLKKFAREGVWSVRPVPADQMVEAGCNVEFTDVRIQDDVYATFNFEAFGPAGQCRRNLKLTIGHVERALDVELLARLEAVGYAELLLKR